MARKPHKQPVLSDEVKVVEVSPESEVSTPSSAPEEIDPATFGAKRAEVHTVEVEGAPVTFGVITY